MDILQNILVGVAVIFALWILYSKFFKKPAKKNCGNDDCGCN